MSPYKFTPGQVFKLKPNARISWLVFSNMDGSCVQALRLDSEIGKRVHDWLMSGGDRNNKPATYQEVHNAAKDFWPHDLETAGQRGGNMKNLIQIQQEYMDTVSAGIDRWSHRRNGGHSSRIRHGAYRKAYAALTKWGYTDEQAKQAIRDAHDVMLLERAGVDDPLNHAS